MLENQWSGSGETESLVPTLPNWMRRWQRVVAKGQGPHDTGTLVTARKLAELKQNKKR
jgi:hypothetical protein